MKELIIATLKPSPNIYTVVGLYGNYPNETPEQALQRALDAKSDELKQATENMYLYDTEYWSNRVASLEQENYQIMTYDDYEIAKKDVYIKKEVKETTKDVFNEMLNVLPPLYWCEIDGFEMFCMSEMYTGTITSQYAKYKDKYYTAYVDITDKETWINKRV